jgi:hypothetical protein
MYAAKRDLCADSQLHAYPLRPAAYYRCWQYHRQHNASSFRHRCNRCSQQAHTPCRQVRTRCRQHPPRAHTALHRRKLRRMGRLPLPTQRRRRTAHLRQRRFHRHHLHLHQHPRIHQPPSVRRRHSILIQVAAPLRPPLRSPRHMATRRRQACHIRNSLRRHINPRHTTSNQAAKDIGRKRNGCFKKSASSTRS